MSATKIQKFRLRELLGHPAAAGPAPGRARS
jgi:hypothetical protein